jgi:hypothetical protein
VFEPLGTNDHVLIRSALLYTAHSVRILLFFFLLSFVFDSEDGGSTFLRNINNLQPNYTASHLKRSQP